MPVGLHCRIETQAAQPSQLRFKVSELMAGEREKRILRKKLAERKLGMQRVGQKALKELQKSSGKESSEMLPRGGGI